MRKNLISEINKEEFTNDFYKMTYTELAEKYKVSFGTVSNLRRLLKLRKMRKIILK